MFRAVVCVACFFVASTIASKIQGSNLYSKVLTVEDLDQYLIEHPEMKPSQELTKVVDEGDERSSNDRLNATYMIGKRTADDKLAGLVMQGIEWGTPKDHRFNLVYSNVNKATVITFVEIRILQGWHDTRSYITSGGIGQSHITIIVEAKSTPYFLCVGRIFVEESNGQPATTTETPCSTTTLEPTTTSEPTSTPCDVI